MTKLQDFLNSPVNVIAPSIRGVTAGDLFGIEVECEGKNVGFLGAAADILNDWAPHNDGSLRNWKNYPPCEWVFNGPANYKKSVERVNNLFDMFEKNKAQLHCSNRTSIHIHFNMGDKTAYQLINTYILFTILEDLLDSYCGEDRNGNLFCLSSRHAEGQVRWLEDAIFKNYRIKFNDNWRYCSLNLASLNKFGTIEFRGMRGLDNREDVLAWLSIVNELCTYGCYEMKNPVDLVEGISMKTPVGFIKEVFSRENFSLITKGISEDQIGASVYEGLRLVQMLCYKIGTEFDQVRLRGKDFWATFSDEKEPARDIDPKDILAGAKDARVNPFGEPGRVLFGGRRRPANEAIPVNPVEPRWVGEVRAEPDGPAPVLNGWARVIHDAENNAMVGGQGNNPANAFAPDGLNEWIARINMRDAPHQNPMAEQVVRPAPIPMAPDNFRWDEELARWVPRLGPDAPALNDVADELQAHLRIRARVEEREARDRQAFDINDQEVPF